MALSQRRCTSNGMPVIRSRCPTPPSAMRKRPLIGLARSARVCTDCAAAQAAGAAPWAAKISSVVRGGVVTTG